jgi:glycosyltransferase involved in cell wall biosynthesis
MFVKVAANIKKRGGKQHVRFVIVGDGESLASARRKSAELGVSYSFFVTEPRANTDIVVTSWETEIDQVMAGLDIVVLTSYNEGTPVSLIEAQAARKPIVSTAVGGVKDLITHGHNGFLTAVNDVEAFANSVNTLIENKALRIKMGEAGFDMVVNKYSKQRLLKDIKKYVPRLPGKRQKNSREVFIAPFSKTTTI